MPDITKFVDSVQKAIEDDATPSEHRELLHDLYASYRKVEKEINKDNYLKILKAEMEKAGVADNTPGDFLFKYSTAVYGAIIKGVEWIDKNVPTIKATSLTSPEEKVIYEEGTAKKKITEAGYKKKDEEQQA